MAYLYQLCIKKGEHCVLSSVCLSVGRWDIYKTHKEVLNTTNHNIILRKIILL